MAAPITLAGSTPRTLSAQAIDTCTRARSEAEVRSLWGRIKDWFLGTHKEDAKLAIFRLANAPNAQAQFDAFLELIGYVAPAHRDQLHFCVGENEAPAFRVADHRIEVKDDWRGLTASETLTPDDTARLLLSLRYQDLPVAAEFHDFGVGLLHDRTADSVLNSQWLYLVRSPELVRALEWFGLHRNDAEGDFAYQVDRQVEKMYFETCANDEAAARAGRNAMNLAIIVTEMVRTRETFDAIRAVERRADIPRA
ncbi:hypothetical protein LV28_07090 [Pandoraea pnomenusa]|jgi:hypothetical protein|uniref:Uncharacterized protein n=3 Tax=Pandoraea pnomenusa TaxID=93220 RepID=A0A378YGY2_9BURK|nr:MULTISPECIES: hypothetical protein [Pandoraea]AHB78349.1 hypothetical protein X636_03025 [Pandoraea pnomenusa]AHN77633.1 hypothetical protein DA70_23620 [Pandoraea pnomenusa]AIU26340.1 hypothetical protein LV28_07090 [Pandoraea pnomenusa]ANC43581.1 hypothetical protein A6P55_04270 [Pandoraea pnomenusa]SUA76446.1 Uncharacterised protein [Pandoraea pnomenusa]